MKFRGSTALEMIIVMIILLVVAGVIISLFLNTFSNVNLPTPPAVQQFRDKVQRECNALCSNYKSGRDALSGSEYCKQQFKFDFNQDKDFKDQFQTKTLVQACEDSFYCSHEHKCEIEGGEFLSPKKCREILCSALEEKYTTLGSADPARDAEVEIQGLIKRGTCELPQGQDWYAANYEPAFGERLCG